MRFQELRLLSPSDRRIFDEVTAFVRDRLSDTQVLLWAAGLGVERVAERAAVRWEVDRAVDELSPPFRNAWTLVLECLDSGHLWSNESAVDQVEIKDRLAKGDLSGDVISRVVSLVSPVLKAGPPRRTARGKPKNVEDLLSVSLEGPNPIDPQEVGLDDVDSPEFLHELAVELHHCIVRVSTLAVRIWKDAASWQLSSPKRVQYVRTEDRGEDEHEPDEFGGGLSAAAKLLCVVTERLADLDPDRVRSMVAEWRLGPNAILKRIWSVLAQQERFASTGAVEEYLLNLDDHEFWSVGDYPENALLRAKRFDDLSIEGRQLLELRTRKGPPRSHWGKGLSTDRIREMTGYWAAREVARIGIAANSLSESSISWLSDKGKVFPELLEMNDLEDGFGHQKKAVWVKPNPDSRYDSLHGVVRLAALEAALAAVRTSWRDTEAESAADWINAPGNASLLIRDLSGAPRCGSDYPLVWSRFGWAYRAGEGAGEAETARTTKQILHLIDGLSVNASRLAIDGLTAWLSSTKVVYDDLLVSVWRKLWPIAVSATNAAADASKDPLNTTVRGVTDAEPRNLDTLNTPAGHLVGVFLRACPRVDQGVNPFDGSSLGEMRDECFEAEGRSGLIARHRLLEHAGYFLHTDPRWTTKLLFSPLMSSSEDAVILWRAIAQKRQFQAVIEKLGREMAERATDVRLGRSARSNLAVSLVLEVLHSLRVGRVPAIPFEDVTQMLRSLQGDARAECAGVLEKFVTHVSAGEDHVLPEELFSRAISPFLANVWPQEVSLSTPSVSKALADLPAACGKSFAACVEAIERFLVPFESWSLFDYGLRDRGEVSRLAAIDSRAMADALLVLLDRTIGGEEGVAAPMDLDKALEQIRSVSGDLERSRVYRRLAAITRRR